MEFSQDFAVSVTPLTREVTALNVDKGLIVTQAPLLDPEAVRSDERQGTGGDGSDPSPNFSMLKPSDPSPNFSMLKPGSAAMNESSLLLDPGSSNALILIAFSITAYVILNIAVFALTPTVRALSQHEYTASAIVLSMQVASLLHDALACQRISESERDTHRCIVVVKVLAALTNAMLCFLPSTPFILDAITGRPNSMLRWVRARLAALLARGLHY